MIRPLLLTLFALPCLAAEEHPSQLTLDAIFTDKTYDQASVPAIHWLAESHRYTTLEEVTPADEDNDKPATHNIVLHDPSTDKTTTLATPENLTLPDADAPLAINAFTLSKDQKKLLIYTNSKRVWRKKSRGDYYLFHIAKKTLTQLGGTAAIADPATLKYANFSPDSKNVAYVQNSNLFVQSLADFETTQLTTDGSPTLINGTFDWVYEEEFGLHRGFEWSHDSKHIAYWQIDDSRVEQFTLVNYTDDLYPELTTFAYPKVGQLNPAARAFVVPAAGGDPVHLQIPGDPRDNYITRLTWVDAPKRVIVRQIPRLQNTAHLYAANPRNGKARRFFTDKSDTWFDDRFQTTWLGDDHSSFLWLTDRDNWRRPLKISRDGKTTTPLVAAPADTSILGHSDSHAYLSASPDNATQRYLYATSLDGENFHRLTPPEFTGSNSYSISPDGTHAIHRHSTFDQPTITTLIKLPSHERLRLIEDNTDLNEKLNALDRPQTDFLRIPVADNVELDAYRITPPDFDPAKKYPSIFLVYGEPAGQTVRDSWGGTTHLWHHYMAQQGYIIYSVDNRGTASPRGAAFRKHVYKKVGILAPQDQAAAVKHLLKTSPYLDPERIGAWGHSGGGSMTLNAMFRYPDLYSAGVAIAFIADQRLYDTIYQERYMGVPPDNEQNYIDGSPITHAEHLKGDLLLIYGTGDDNCHYQNCERLINELVEHNKPFELLTYPNRTHSIKERKNTLLHRFTATTNFFNRTLR